MGYSAVVRALQQGRQVMVATLVELDFTSGPCYVWDGAGSFTDVNGQAWQGLGQLVSVSQFDREVASGRPPSLVLSGVDRSLADKALAGSAEVKGRYFRIFDQYFDGATLQPVDAPNCLLLGVMDQPTAVITADSATITVTTTTIFHRRRRVALAYLSDATQRTLYPGDAGASEMSRLVQATEIWPGYNG